MPHDQHLPQISAAPQSPNASVAFSELPLQAQRDHRIKLGVRVMAIMNQFWVDEKTPDVIRVVEIEGWLDVLQVLSETEVRAAWATYQQTGPRTDTRVLKRPDPGALLDLAMHSRMIANAMKKPKEALVVEPERPPPTEAQKLAAARAVASFASERRMVAIRAAPMATTFDEAEAMVANRSPAFRVQPTPEALEAARAASPMVQEARQAARIRADAVAAREAMIAEERAQDARGG
jgi:hypothetical protein